MFLASSCHIDKLPCDREGVCFCINLNGERFDLCPRFDVKRARGIVKDAFEGRLNPPNAPYKGVNPP